MCTCIHTHTYVHFHRHTRSFIVSISAFFCGYNCVRCCILPSRLLLHSDSQLCCFIALLNTNNKEHCIVDIEFDIIKNSCVHVCKYTHEGTYGLLSLLLQCFILDLVDCAFFHLSNFIAFGVRASQVP